MSPRQTARLADLVVEWTLIDDAKDCGHTKVRFAWSVQ